MARGTRGGMEAARASLARIRKGELAPVYLIHGPESFLRDEALHAIRDAVLGGEDSGFNHDVFQWDGARGKDIASAARTLPFMASRRLVEVHGIGQLREEEAAQLMPLIENPPPDAVLVFAADRADMRRTFFRKIGEADASLKMEPPSERELPGWAQSHAKGLGFTLTREAAMLLTEWVEPSLGRVRAELDKLVSYIGPGGTADEDAVRDLVGRSKVDAMYKLGDALAGGDVSRSLALARDLCATDAGPQFLIGFLRNQIRRWTIAKAGARRGMSEKELAELLGVPPFAAGRVRKNVARVSGRFLRGLYAKLAEADRRVKRSGRGKPALQAIEMFIMELSREGGGFAATGRGAAGAYRS